MPLLERLLLYSPPRLLQSWPLRKPSLIGIFSPHDFDSDGSQVTRIKGLPQTAHLVQYAANCPDIGLAIVGPTLRHTAGSRAAAWLHRRGLVPCTLQHLTAV